jgi:phage terminase small subunit
MAAKKTKKGGSVAVARAVEGSIYPLPPEDLPRSAHDMWHRVCGYLHGEGFDMEVAYPQIFNYCFQDFVHRYNSGEVSNSETPGVEIFSNGNRGVCKNYDAVNTSRKQLDIFEKNWGFTPLAAAKISKPEKNVEPEDEFDL